MFMEFTCVALGSVVYLTCPDEPTAVLSKLKQKSSSLAVLVGRYTLSSAPSGESQLVEVTVVKHGVSPSQSPARRQRGQRTDTSSDYQLHMVNYK